MINIPLSINIPVYYLWDGADIIVRGSGDNAVAVLTSTREKIAEGEIGYVVNKAIESLPKASDDYGFNGGGRILVIGSFNIRSSIVIDRDNVELIANAKLLVEDEMDAVIYLGVSKQVYRVMVAGFRIDCNGLAEAGIRAYPSTGRGVVDSVIAYNTVVNAVQNGVDGYYYGSLIMRNVCNYSKGAGIVIQGGQHVTLFDNSTYMNSAPGLILSLGDTAYVIRHKSLSDNQSNRFWKCAVALNGMKMHVLRDFEIWTSNSGELEYAIRIWPKNNPDEYYYAVVRDGVIRDEGDVDHLEMIRFEAYGDKHIGVVENVDGRQADSRYAYSLEVVNDAGILVVRNFKTSLSPVVKNMHRLVEQPYRLITSCSSLPSIGVEKGQSIACYDDTAAKYVLKIWDGQQWQTIG